MVSVLQDLCMISLLEVVFPGILKSTILFALATDYIRYCDPIEILQAKGKNLLSAGPLFSKPGTLDKQNSSCVRPNKITYMFYTQGR